MQVHNEGFNLSFRNLVKCNKFKIKINRFYLFEKFQKLNLKINNFYYE